MSLRWPTTKNHLDFAKMFAHVITGKYNHVFQVILK